MSDYIDPRTRPWDHMTDDIYQYMKAEWECSVATVPVADTEANRIKEYRAVTGFWKRKYGRNVAASSPVFLNWIQTTYEESKVNPFDHRGCPPSRERVTTY